MDARATTGAARAPGHAEVLAGIALLSFLVARFLPVLSLPYTCPVKGTFGIPCATCGMTHAFVALAHGEVRRAVAASPLGALLAGAAWAAVPLDLLRLALDRPLPSPSTRALRWAGGLGLAALLANWAWLVAHRG